MLLTRPHSFARLHAPQRKYRGAGGLLLSSVVLLHLGGRSRALASLLPAFVASGAITLTVSAMMRLLSLSPQLGFVHGWMTDWLLTWAVGFPLAYIAQLAIAWLVQGGSRAAISR